MRLKPGHAYPWADNLSNAALHVAEVLSWVLEAARDGERRHALWQLESAYRIATSKRHFRTKAERALPVEACRAVREALGLKPRVARGEP